MKETHVFPVNMLGFDNHGDQATATGLYLFTVEDKQTGIIKEGKFLIMK